MGRELNENIFLTAVLNWSVLDNKQALPYVAAACEVHRLTVKNMTQCDGTLLCGIDRSLFY
jgi:hypothetical protein